VDVRDLGEHALKDISSRVRLHQLEITGLRSDFPPPRTLDAHPSNLLPQSTPLVEVEQKQWLDRIQRELDKLADL
jgi:hypothetical protein